MRWTQLTTLAAILGTAATPLALAVPASAAEGGASTAYGVFAGGLVNIPRTPAVSSATRPSDKSVAELPANPLVDLKVLHVTARPGRARASVTDLKVAKAALAAHLVTAECVGGKASSHLVNASLGGRRLAANAAPNSALSVPVHGLGTVKVVLNKQVRSARGLTVTAIELSLPLVAGRSQTVSISSATCKGNTPGHPSSPSKPPSATAHPTPTSPATPPGEAPKPTPVPGDLPVTG